MNTRTIRPILISLACAVAALALCVLLGAVAANRADDPDKLTAPAAYAAVIVSAFVGGAAATRLGGTGSILNAVFFALAYAALHIVAHLIAGGPVRLLPLVALYAAMLFSAVAAGLIFRQRGGSRSKTVRKMKRYSKQAR